jgi:predicted nucleotidyltransferase
MSSISKPLDLARRAGEEYKACYGKDLVSVIVFGSAAGADFDPKRSDVNMLIILTGMTLALLEKSLGIQERWMKKRFSRPLFMDKEYIGHSLDSFSVEFLNFKESYHLIHGEDVLKDLLIDDHDLRLQVERELKGKWLHLARGWLNVKNHPSSLRRLLKDSMNDFSAIFRSLLYLKKIPVPKGRKAVFAAITKTFALENGALEQTLDAYGAGKKNAMTAVFPVYFQAIKQLSQAVDHLSIEEHP